jgi:beta-galactosidase/beta-glucuronidase
MEKARQAQWRASEQDGTYPRPQLVRDHWTSLDGPWAFGYDDEDRGVADRWFDGGDGGALDRSIVVPFPPESVASGVGDPGFHPVVWYRRTVTPDDLPKPLGPGDRLLLHFGAVDHQATVWCGRRQVAEHVGGQTPFTADITDDARAGEWQVVVRAYDDAKDAAQPTGKQDWRLQPHGIWYHRTTGIWQTVWLEVVPATRVAALDWTTDLRAGVVTLAVEVSGDVGGEGRGLSVDARLSSGRREVAAAAEVSAGRCTLRLPVAGLAADGRAESLAWSPEQPRLLDAVVTLRTAAGEPVDVVRSYAGLRTVGLGEHAFLLNGRPYYVRAVLDQGYWTDTHLANPGTAWLRDEVEVMKAMGFNAVRVHQKAEDPRFLYWADRLGLLVWGETANARRFSKRATELLTREWADLVRRDRSHPCLVTWVPVNESWGVPKVAERPRQQQYVAALARLTRELDPTRPVVSNDGWEHVDSDIIGIHDYTSKGWRIRRRYGSPARIRKTLQSGKPGAHRLVVTERQWERLDQESLPVMLTEFGGVSYAGAAGTWGYTTVRDDGEYERVLRRVFDAVRACPDVVGFCYTQLLDTLQETNGLLTADRTPKLPVSTIRSIVTGEPG